MHYYGRQETIRLKAEINKEKYQSSILRREIGNGLKMMN